MKPTIGISDAHLKNVSGLLNKLLADEFMLYAKTRNAHWNIQGIHFSSLHKFFEEQYEMLDEVIDDTAERVRSLGHYALGSLRDFIAVARLEEDKIDFSASDAVVLALLEDHETIIRILRKDIQETTDKFKDVGTGDFLTGLMEKHEKMAWMLRSHLTR